jgi:hypothetical protein
VPRGQRDGSLRPYSRFSRPGRYDIYETSLIFLVLPELFFLRISSARCVYPRQHRNSCRVDYMTETAPNPNLAYPKGRNPAGDNADFFSPLDFPNSSRFDNR